MKFIAPAPKPGRTAADTVSVRITKNAVMLNIPAKTAAQMGWVKGDKIEVGHTGTSFGLRRAKAGFALVSCTPNHARLRVQFNPKYLPEMCHPGTVETGGEATSVVAADGILFIGDPTVAKPANVPGTDTNSQQRAWA